jgi:hypothetical protein
VSAEYPDGDLFADRLLQRLRNVKRSMAAIEEVEPRSGLPKESKFPEKSRIPGKSQNPGKLGKYTVSE